MAFRKFYEKDPIHVSDTSPIERGIANLFQGVGRVYEERKKKSDQYKYALDYGKFENDNQFLEKYVSSVIGLGKSDYKNSGAPSMQLLEMEEAGKRYKADMDAQYKRFSDLDGRINKQATEDPYYDPEIDKKTLEGAAFGEDNDVDFRTRGERLNEASQFIGSDPRSFKLNNYVADYIKQRGEKSVEKGTTGDNGGRTYSFKTPFVDPKTGKPGVTDDHAVDFLKSNPKVMSRVQWDVDQDLVDDVDAIIQLRNKGDKRAAWAEDMEPAEVLMQIKAKSELNPFDQTPYNELITKKAKQKLTEASSIAEKTLVDFKKPSGDGPVSNDNIGHSYTFQNNSFNTSTPGGLGPENPNRPKNVAGPGGLLMIKKGVTAGKPIVIEAGSSNAFSYNTGKNFNRGTGKLNLTGYQLAPYNNEGKLIPIEANSPEELKQKINEMSPEQMRNMSPNMGVALQGYSIDDGKFLADVSNRTLKLSEDLGKAIEDGDTETENKIRNQMGQLDALKNAYSTGSLADDDVNNMASQAGIKSIRNNQLVKADNADLDKVKTITGGLDLKDKSKWSEEMREVDDVWNKKWQEAQSAPASNKKKASKFPLPKGNPQTVTQNGFEYTWNPETGQYE